MTINTQRAASVGRQVLAILAITFGVLTQSVSSLHLPVAISSILTIAGAVIIAIEHYVGDPSTGTPYPSATRPYGHRGADGFSCTMTPGREYEFREDLIHVLREIRDVIMGANDDALTALQADFATLQTDVTALIAAVQAGGTPVNSDISAGVNAVVTDMNTLDASVKAANPPAAAAASSPTDPSVVSDPAVS